MNTPKKNAASEFGRRLRELRQAADLTQKELADRASMHEQGIVKLERGEREPAWSSLLALAEALGVSLASFAEQAEGPRTPNPSPLVKTKRPKARKRT